MPMTLERFAADTTFERDLEVSTIAVGHTASWFSARGYPVVVQPTFVRPSLAEMSAYADHGDLHLMVRIEAKHRPSIDFTGPHDFPFQTIIVDTVHSWDRAKPKPFAYAIWDADYSHFALVLGETSRFWSVVQREDRARGRTRRFYECPLQHVRFLPRAA